MTNQRPDRHSFAAGVGIAVLMMLCCAGPVLIAAGALGAIGAALANPFVIAIGALVAVVAVVWAVRR